MSFDLANFCEAKDLKAAAVRKDWPRPIDEFVQAASLLDDFQSRANVEMIGVAENNLRAHLDQFARVERFDAALRTHGHEHGRFDHTVFRSQPTKARLRLSVGF